MRSGHDKVPVGNVPIITHDSNITLHMYTSAIRFFRGQLPRGIIIIPGCLHR